ncbi:MAG: hypothetical protein IME99_08785 [Proteobacteria bacterium]|nr:hypothetical protein [Pseudomonadota bacterium]
MDRLLNSRWFSPVALLVIALATVIVYSGTFDAPFQFDDQLNILKNRLLHDIGNFGAILFGPRGVTNATFALNYWAGGTSVAGYHIVNTAIHIINATLVYLVILSTLRLAHYGETGARWAAFFTAALFALHPLQTQAVTYIVQRMESLSALFYLLATLLFIRAGLAKSTPLRFALWAAIAITYWCGFYSKESALTLPAIILLYDLFFFSDFKFSLAVKRWPLYALLSILFIFFSVRTVAPLVGIDLFKSASTEIETVTIQNSTTFSQAGPLSTAPTKIVRRTHMDTAGFGMASIGPKSYLYTQFNVITYYFTLLLWPANQNLDYDFPVSSSLLEFPKTNSGAVLNIPLPPPLFSALFLATIVAAAVLLTLRSIKKGTGTLGKDRVIAFFIFWFFIILSPTSSFVPIRDVIYEHRLYLPSVGFFLVVVLIVEGLLGNKKSTAK